jgi:hemoglobin
MRGTPLARSLSLVVALAALLALAGCVQLGWDDRSLYVQLGEKPGIDQLVDRFIRELARDERIRGHFQGIDIRRLREQLAFYLCERSGGPCRYEGAPLREVHRHLGVSEADFNALVEDLIDAMEGLDVPTPTQNELLALLAPEQVEIVEPRRAWWR